MNDTQSVSFQDILESSTVSVSLLWPVLILLALAFILCMVLPFLGRRRSLINDTAKHQKIEIETYWLGLSIIATAQQDHPRVPLKFTGMMHPHLLIRANGEGAYPNTLREFTISSF